jgi:hypothetical protein
MADDDEILVRVLPARPGRPRVADPHVTISATFPSRVADELAHVAIRQGVSVSQLIRVHFSESLEVAAMKSDDGLEFRLSARELKAVQQAATRTQQSAESFMRAAVLLAVRRSFEPPASAPPGPPRPSK